MKFQTCSFHSPPSKFCHLLPSISITFSHCHCHCLRSALHFFLPGYLPIISSPFYWQQTLPLVLHQLPSELHKMIKAHSLLLVFGNDFSSVLSVGSMAATRARGPEAKFQLCCLVTMWPWTSSLASPGIRLLRIKRGIITILSIYSC